MLFQIIWFSPCPYKLIPSSNIILNFKVNISCQNIYQPTPKSKFRCIAEIVSFEIKKAGPVKALPRLILTIK
jgi:hypothetical protein